MTLIVTVAATILLTIDNQTPVSLRFLHLVSPPWPVSWWMALAFASGAVAGLVACLGHRALRRGRR